MAIEFESSMQNLVYQVDAGSGRKVIQTVLFALFAFAMAALYTFANFQGLKDPRAMEEAQVARNLATQGRWTTQCVRPLSMGLLAARSPDGNAAVASHPDLRHPPVWPAILAAAFRATGVPKTDVPTTSRVYGGDYVVVGTSHLFVILSALLVLGIGFKLFDRRVGALSAGAFLVSDLVWRRSLAGTDWSAAMFFALGAVYAALWAAELPPGAGTGPQPTQGPAWRWAVPLAVSSVLTAAAFLTRYAAGSVALLVFLYVGVSRRRHPWAKAFLYAGLALLGAVPWLARNVSASGHLFGLVPREVLAGTYLFPGDALARSLQPEWPDAGAALYAVQLKMIGNLRAFFADGFGWGGAGILLGLFGAMYFHRFVRHSSRTLRWCLLPAACAVALSAAAFGEESLPALAIFWPLAIPFGWAFFLVLLDRLQFDVRFFDAGAVAAVMFLSGLPLLLNVVPPRTGLPYPPYFHPYVGWVSNMAEPGECLTTDIPWATAWYGGRTSILLPKTIDGFYEINDRHQKIALAYFTTVTRDKPWIRGLADPVAPEHSWYQIFAEGKVPGNFPLAHGRFIAGRDQFVLADRVRW